MEIIKSSDAFKPTQPMENITEVTTWHWASIADQPPPDDFADMLENIFSGHPSNPSPPPQLTEADWNLQELQIAIKRMKANKASDECGLVAELLHFAPGNVLCTILNIMNTILRDGEIHARGVKRCSKCCQKRNNPKSQLISGPLQTSASCTKFLHI